MINKTAALIICLLLLLSCAACRSVTQHSDNALYPETSDIELPEDFSFSMVWGTYGVSSYDSKSGKLVKTKDATDIGKYTTYVKMSKGELQTIYRCLFCDIDITKYPDSYDPFNAPGAKTEMMSEPNQTIIITATANGSTKTVTCTAVAFGSLKDCYSDEARAFLTAKQDIVDLITSFPEWKAFPDHEFFYQ